MSRAPALGLTLGVAALFSVAAVHLDATALALMRLSTLGAALGALAGVDLADHRIPNRIVAPAAVVCATLLLAEGVHVMQLLGGLALVASMLVLSLAWPASLGMGDVKLALLVVFGLGDVATPALLLGLTLAAITGGLLLVWRGRSATTQSLPLAPFIAAGATAVVVLA